MFYALQLAAVAAACCLCPPLATFLATGFSSRLITTTLATALFWFGGVAHSAYVCWTELLVKGGS